MDYVAHLLEETAYLVDLVGICIILYGFVLAATNLLRVEFRRLGSGFSNTGLHNVRILLGTYILTGIEFMIASDIIHTVLSRELIDLAFVSALVVIRTAISFFLAREVSQLDAESSAHARS